MNGSIKRFVYWISGTTVASAAGFLFVKVISDNAGPFVGFFLGGLAFGTILGVAQWLSLRDWLPLRWVPAKVFAAGIGFWAGSYMGLVGAYAAGPLGLASGLGITLGISIGFADILIVPAFRSIAGRWIIASSIGMAAGLVVGDSFLPLLNLDYTSPLGWILPGGFAGLLYGIATGLTIQRGYGISQDS